MSSVSTSLLCQAAGSHFTLLYEELVTCQFSPDATIDTVEGFKRCFSGSPDPFDNGILSSPSHLQDDAWDQHVIQQLEYFKTKQRPFAWHVENKSNPPLEAALIKHGFEKQADIHVIAGPTGPIINNISLRSQRSYEITFVQGEENHRQLTEFVRGTFSYSDELQPFYLMLFMNPVWSHWVAKKNNRVVAAISTMIKDGVVSFWNAGTAPEHRRKYLCSELTAIALQNAVQAGCKIAVAYLNSEQAILNMARTFGGEKIYSFQTYYAPK